MMAQLNLSEAQQEQMRTIRQQARQQSQALREAGDRAGMRALRRSTREQVRAVLTPEQRAQAQQLRQAQHEQMFERRMTHITERLQLSAQQAQQVRSILSHAHTQRRAIMEQARLDETPPREAFEALRTNTRAQLSTVLTEEQLAALGEMRRHHRRGRGEPHGRRGQRGPRAPQ